MQSFRKEIGYKRGSLDARNAPAHELDDVGTVVDGYSRSTKMRQFIAEKKRKKYYYIQLV